MKFKWWNVAIWCISILLILVVVVNQFHFDFFVNNELVGLNKRMLMLSA